jgi:glycosyltransferase involved in cell wall biosynthesis
MDHVLTRGCVVLPAYNVAPTVGPLIRAIRGQGLAAIVVDDGSRDATGAEAIKAGAFVIGHVANRGKGLALRAGFTQALRAGYELVVTMDSDGQHDPTEIPKLIHAVGRDRLALGHRVMDRRTMPLARDLTNRLMSAIVSRVAGQPIPDALCGFRCLPAPLLRQVRLTGERFDADVELLLHAARRGWTVVSVPIRTIYRRQPSAIRPLPDTWRLARLFARHLRRRAPAEATHGV